MGGPAALQSSCRSRGQAQTGYRNQVGWELGNQELTRGETSFGAFQRQSRPFSLPDEKREPTFIDHAAWLGLAALPGQEQIT